MQIKGPTLSFGNEITRTGYNDGSLTVQTKEYGVQTGGDGVRIESHSKRLAHVSRAVKRQLHVDKISPSFHPVSGFAGTGNN